MQVGIFLAFWGGSLQTFQGIAHSWMDADLKHALFWGIWAPLVIIEFFFTFIGFYDKMLCGLYNKIQSV